MDNREFWNRRYRTQRWIRSGPGSRASRSTTKPTYYRTVRTVPTHVSSQTWSRIEFGWEFRFSQYREPLSSPVRRCTGFAIS